MLVENRLSLVLVRYCPARVSLLMWRHRRRRPQLHSLAQAARTASPLLPRPAGICRVRPVRVRIGAYVVGAEGDDLLLGHPDIRY